MTTGRAWLGVTGAAGALALWLDCSSLHEFQHADSLIPVLASTERWTPYFWGQDRFGMLVPLLAMPVNSPFANLLFQAWIMITAALVAPFAVARFVVDRPAQWVAAGALTNLLLFAATAAVTQFDWLVVQPYALSLTLGFAGLAAVDRATIGAAIVACVLLVLAHWVNVGVAVPLGAAVVMRWRRPWPAAALLLVAGGLGAWLMRALPPTHTTTALSPPSTWIGGWIALARSAASLIAHPMALAAALLASAIGAAVVWHTTDRTRVARMVAVPIAAAAVTWIVVGASEWVRLNLYYPRYTFPSMVLLGVAVGLTVSAAAARRTEALAVVACCLAGIAAVTVVGTPSLTRVSRRLDARFGRMTPAVLASGAVAIAGDYWTVWPAVFHANVALSRSLAPRRVFGLTYRSEATDAIWSTRGASVVVAAAAGDESAVSVAARHDVSLTLRERVPPVDLFDGRVGPAAQAR